MGERPARGMAGAAPEVSRALDTLAAQFNLSSLAQSRLAQLLRLILEDSRAPTAIRDPLQVIDRHFADSLVGLGLDLVRAATTVVDLGSGAGFPGLPLAIARPSASVTLVDSNARKCAFLERAVAACGLTNVSVVNARLEGWPAGRGRFDLAVARAVGELDVVIEYAAPLLRVGGWLVAWRGRRDDASERRARAAGAMVGMQCRSVLRTRPFPAARDHHLHLILKARPTPPRYPRRPGVAMKRPLGRSAG